MVYSKFSNIHVHISERVDILRGIHHVDTVGSYDNTKGSELYCSPL